MGRTRYAEDMQRGERRERWTVDGIEDGPRGPVARLEREDGRTFDLPLSALPDGVREGDVLGVEEGPDGVSARRLPHETRARREHAQRTLNTLNADSGEEEITL